MLRIFRTAEKRHSFFSEKLNKTDQLKEENPFLKEYQLFIASLFKTDNFNNIRPLKTLKLILNEVFDS